MKERRFIISLTLIFIGLAWWLFDSPYKDYSSISALFALLLPILDNGFRSIRKEIKKQGEQYSVLKPEVIESYLKVTKNSSEIDYSLSLVASKLMGEVKTSFDALINSDVEKNEAFFNLLKERISKLE